MADVHKTVLRIKWQRSQPPPPNAPPNRSRVSEVRRANPEYIYNVNMLFFKHFLIFFKIWTRIELHFFSCWTLMVNSFLWLVTFFRYVSFQNMVLEVFMPFVTLSNAWLCLLFLFLPVLSNIQRNSLGQLLTESLCPASFIFALWDLNFPSFFSL